MKKDEINEWKNKYDDEEEYDKSVEEELQKKFQKNNFITKKDLKKIVKWKFQSKRLKGRRTRILNLLKEVEKSYIKEISKLAFKRKEDKYRLKLFETIDGIGNSIGSVILTFYNPEKYGILDIHSWRGLFGEEPSNLYSTKNALKFLKKLRKKSLETDLSCRDIEKAYFEKDK